ACFNEILHTPSQQSGALCYDDISFTLLFIACSYKISYIIALWEFPDKTLSLNIQLCFMIHYENFFKLFFIVHIQFILFFYNNVTPRKVQLFLYLCNKIQSYFVYNSKEII